MTYAVSRICFRPVRQGEGVRWREGRRQDPSAQVRDQDHLEVPDASLEREVRSQGVYFVKYNCCKDTFFPHMTLISAICLTDGASRIFL